MQTACLLNPTKVETLVVAKEKVSYVKKETHIKGAGDSPAEARRTQANQSQARTRDERDVGDLRGRSECLHGGARCLQRRTSSVGRTGQPAGRQRTASG